MALENPYAHSLDGLKIEDPVKSFFDYCKEREAVRVKRESGESFPWSDDPILRKGRFLNVFREDDKVSKSIIKFAEPAKDDLPLLVQALFFSRWCNRDSTIDQLTLGDLSNPEALKEKLINLKQWENYTAYPVEDSHWDEKLHSRIDAATYKFYEKKDELAQIVLNSNRNVITATNNINKQFMMSNDFPIFMALIDIAWFREDIIPITTDVPTGIGAEPYLDRLQMFLNLNSHQDVGLRMIELQEEYWPEAKREFYPIDIEYQSCECRKYFSYVNGTKKFEGKNLFSV
ncbi:putative DNA base hypermodification protein [Candidatus Actinomarina]|nr:putative DNA base hypermodification protein [Candidatus Actinomarina sp.]